MLIRRRADRRRWIKTVVPDDVERHDDARSLMPFACDVKQS